MIKLKDVYEKKFTMGLNSNILYEDYDLFLKKYSKYIHSIYFSLPIGDEYSTRPTYSKGLKTKEQIKNWWGLVETIKANNIKTEICMNVVGLDERKIDCAIEFMQQKLIPDEIVCITTYYDKLKKAFPDCKIIYSFNNIVPEHNLSGIIGFDEVVVGKSYLLSEEKRKNLTDAGYPIRLLLNNGCFFDCVYCNDMCRNKFKKQLSIYDIENMYANQSFWPKELKKLVNSTDSLNNIKFKLSTRTKNLKAQEICLASYLYGEDIEKYINKDYMSYNIWCGLGYFADYYRQFEFDRVKRIKIENGRI